MDELIDRWVIDTVGLEEEIRCEMCKNPMHTNRGCDGGCSYDEGLYKRIIKVLSDRIKPLQPEKPEIIHCKDCEYTSGDDYCHCKYVTWWNNPDDYCSRAEKRGEADG